MEKLAIVSFSKDKLLLIKKSWMFNNVKCKKGHIYSFYSKDLNLKRPHRFVRKLLSSTITRDFAGIIAVEWSPKIFFGKYF